MRSNSENLIEYVGYFYSHFLETICLRENKAETHDGAFSDEIIVKRCHVGREETVFKKSCRLGLEHVNFRTGQGGLPTANI